MAAYFHGNPPEISAGADGSLQTLILMNPTTYVQFSDHHHHNQQETTSHNNNNNNSLVFLNPSHAPPPPHPTAGQQFVGIPLSAHEATTATATATAVDSISAATLHGFLPRVQYNLYGNHPHMDPTCETPRAASQQGLSLTLSSQQQQHRPPQPHQQIGFGAGEDIRVGSGSTGSGVTNGLSGLLSSKYLKATQELLDEIVNVNTNNINGKTELLSSSNKKGSSGDKMIGESSAGAGGEGSVGCEAAGKRAAELSTAERQEIQMKKAKLISMLDEVEQRYRQYHQQMQIVITSFEQAAGKGSAKSYTSLALKTISRQFRCLKDAITGQIKAANKCLGEEDSSSGGRFEGSRLRFVDHQLRQQRALQQLGMIQHHSSNAWRPQRGLPERAVSVLRAWLFEHFLHPYPKDSDKHMLAKQTGLTRSQVSNWFINARVRLWKPMVEEMYVEEMKEQGKNNGSVDDKQNQNNNDEAASKSMSNNQEKSPVTENNYQLNNNNQTNHSPELGGVATQLNPKRLKTNNDVMILPVNTDFNTNEKLNMKVLEDRQGLRDGYSFIGNFGHYQIDEIPRFDVSNQHLIAQRFSGNNGVSLTLGLPHCESLSATHQSFMPNHSVQLGRRTEIGESGEFAAMNASASTPHSSSPAYNGIDIQNQKRFIAQLLPDFVA